MFGIILIGLAMLAVLTVGSYSMLSVFSSTTSLIKSQLEIQNLNKIEIVLNHSLKPYGENKSLVAPVDLSSVIYYEGESYLTIPDSLGIKNKNEWKMPYIYCPVSGDSSLITSSTYSEVNYGENSYNIVTFDDNLDDNLDYVLESNLSISSDLLDKETLAIVISPRIGTDIPSCSNIYIKSNGSYGFTEEDGKYFSGLIKVISREESLNYSGIANYSVNVEDFDTDTTLNGLTSTWEAMKPLNYVVDLDDGQSREISSDLSFENNNSVINKSFELKNSEGSITEITSNGSVNLYFKDISIDIENISFSSDIKIVFESSKISLKNVEFYGSVTFTDSELRIDSDSISSGSSSEGMIILDNSRVKQNNSEFSIYNSNAYPAISMSSSKWDMNDSVLEVSSNSGSSNYVINIENDSRVIAKNSSQIILKSTSGSPDAVMGIDEGSSVSINDSQIASQSSSSELIKVKGKMSFVNSSISTTGAITKLFSIESGNVKYYSSSIGNGGLIGTGFELINGGALTLQDSTVGSSSSKLTTGVLDTSAMSVHGTSSIIYASTCVSGYLFEEISSSSYSTPTDESIQEANNRSIWSCQ